MANLNLPGQISAKTGWQLSPLPIPVSVAALEADQDLNWVSYHPPFLPTSFNRPQSYVKYYVSTKEQIRNTTDQWVTPGWEEEDAANGAVWTNETVHFVIDNCVSTLYELINTSKTDSFHATIVRAGLAQREARLNGKDGRLQGAGLDSSELAPFVISTIAVSTEIKRLLPMEGTKWLFMRVTTRSLLNDRMDYDVVLIDEHGELLAGTHHVAQVIRIGRKEAKM